MSFSFSSLSLANVEAAAGVSVLPPGKHIVKITDCKIEATKSGYGHIMKLRMSNKSGVISDNINVDNPNEKAVEIGLGQLKAMLVAAGHKDPDNVGAHGVQAIVGLTVGVIVGSETYQGSERSKVKGYCKPSEAEAKPMAKTPAEKPIGTDDCPF